MRHDPARPPRLARLILSCMKRYTQEHAVSIELEEEFNTDRRLGRIPDDKTIKKEIEELESLRT